MGRIPFALRTPCGAAQNIVRALLKRRQLRKRALFAFKLYLCRGNELGVITYETVLLLHHRHYLRLEALQRQLDIGKIQASELLFKISAEFGMIERERKLLYQRLQFGKLFVKKRVFGIIKFIQGIDSVADICQSRSSFKAVKKLLRLFENGERTFVITRVRQTVRKLLYFGAHLLHIGSDILHF